MHADELAIQFVATADYRAYSCSFVSHTFVATSIVFFVPLHPSSQSEYDIAVIETQARRPVSVKVKQFSLQGARIQNDWQGPQMVKYKNKLHPWKYIVVLPVSRNPIKIASPNLSQLKPVHEGIRRVLQAQQRDRGGPGPTAGPADPYRTGGGGGYDARDRNGGGGGEHPQGNANNAAYYGGRQGGGQNSGY